MEQVATALGRFPVAPRTMAAPFLGALRRGFRSALLGCVQRSLFGLVLALAATDVARAAEGMFKTRKLPSEAVVKPPVEVNKLPNERIVAPEHMQPGTHTVSLDVTRHLARTAHKMFEGFHVRCLWLENGVVHDWGDWGSGPPATGEIGWGEIEYGDSPCAAKVGQVAVHFDDAIVDGVPEKTIDRAVLTYDEGEGYSCRFGWVYGERSTCWQNGDGKPEPKPDGCVVVRVPTVDWSAPTKGLLPYATSVPTIRRIDTREWDVTEPYKWQNEPRAVPLGANPGFGFLLTGSITSLSELEGEDDTICMSVATNIKLHVTYTVPQPSAPPDVIR